MTAPPASNAPRAFAVWFHELKRWDVTFFRGVAWQWPEGVVQPLGNALIRRADDVKGVADTSDLPIIGKISFGGVISLADERARKGYKGRLFWANAGDLIYSKIRVKQGSSAIVPPHFPRLAVSAEYPVYRVKPDVADADYIALVLHSAPFLRFLDGLSHGGSTKTRLHADVFEEQEIPLPPLAVQQAIVAQWHEAQEKIAAARARVRQDEAAIYADVQRLLGRWQPRNSPRPRVFALPWSQIDRWGFDMCLRQSYAAGQAVYPETTIEAVCKISSGGTPSRTQRARFFGGNIPWVKTTEVRNNVITGTAETLTEAGISNSSAKVYPAGSILVAMYGQGATRGRTAKLGIDAATNQACAVLTQFQAGVEPDYVWHYLTSEYERLRELASGNNQPNLNAEMIATYPLPLPPFDVQREIIARVAHARERIAHEQQDADRQAREIKADIEARILGTRPA